MPTPTLSEKVYDQLVAKLINGELLPGEHVTQAALRDELEVSHTSVRAALQILVAQGLLEKHNHRGCFVPKISLPAHCELFAAREAIEGMAARQLSACPDNERQVAHLRDISQRLSIPLARSLTEEDRFLHFGFHRYLVRNCGNSYLAKHMNADALILRAFVFGVSLFPIMELQVTYKHEDIIEAIAAHDADEAERRTRGHIRAGEQNLRKLMAQRARCETASAGSEGAAIM